MTSKQIEDVVSYLREMARDYKSAKKAEGDSAGVMAGRIAQRLAALEWAAEFIELVDSLREEEGAIVTICADNASFGDPQSAIFVTDDWTGWQEMPFEGANILEALRLAMDMRRKVTVDPQDGKHDEA